MEKPTCKYQASLWEFLQNYADNQGVSDQTALRDILGDLQGVSSLMGLDFEKALEECG